MTRLVYAGMTAGRQAGLQVKTHPPAPPSSLTMATWFTPVRIADTAVVAVRLRQSASGDGGVAVIPLTCQLFFPFHPSDGGDGLAADGGAGELRLIALADHVLAALDDRAARRDWTGRF